MLMEWLKPAIDQRMENAYDAFNTDPEIMKLLSRYNNVVEKLKKTDSNLFLEIDSTANAIRTEAQLFSYRTGLTDGLALHREISTIRLQPMAQNKENTISLEMVTRSLAEVAKGMDEREWELRDLLEKKKIDTCLLHHAVDDMLELIHNLNGVPKEGKDGFTRDNWDDDFLRYFAGDIGLDQCLEQYDLKLAALKL